MKLAPLQSKKMGDKWARKFVGDKQDEEGNA